MSVVRVNLIPVELLQRQRHRIHVKRWLVAIGCALVIDCVPVVLQWMSMREAEQLGAHAATLAAEVTLLRAEVKKAGTAADELFLQLERSRALRTKRSWSSMITMIATAMPVQCWLTYFGTDPDTPPAGAQAKKTEIAPPSPQPANATNANMPPAPNSIVTIEAPRKLKLSGMAREASQPLGFVTALRDTRAFKTVTLERTIRGRGTDGDVFQFELTCEW